MRSFASAEDNEETYGVSLICPEEYEEGELDQSKGPSIPPNDDKHTHNVAKAPYKFAGRSENNAVYTEKWLTGKNHYKIHVNNNGKYKLTVKAKRRTKTYAYTTISAGKSATLEFSGIKKTTKFYVYFKGSSFNGTVS